MKKERILYSITEVDSDFIGDTPDKILDGLNEGTNYINYDYKKHRYLITFISDYFNVFDKIEEDKKEIERLNNIINELEKYLENRNSFFKEMSRDYGTHHDLLDENENILDKLKELKESDEK